MNRLTQKAGTISVIAVVAMLAAAPAANATETVDDPAVSIESMTSENEGYSLATEGKPSGERVLITIEGSDAPTSISSASRVRISCFLAMTALLP